MEKDPRDSVFWEIIEYLNNNHMIPDSRIWKTPKGFIWVWWGKFGWERQWIDSMAEWPLPEIRKKCPVCQDRNLSKGEVHA